ncbi:MAG: hypothetical protein Q8K57_00190 [Thiobacillus sp.]|nr:hypothetical protein [Thiobacillus sp.]MDP3125284.1 hypothetical protein [Thiobacillus sp.]
MLNATLLNRYSFALPMMLWLPAEAATLTVNLDNIKPGAAVTLHLDY